MRRRAGRVGILDKRKGILNHVRIPGSGLEQFYFTLRFSVFILGVPFLQERETLKRWLEFSVFSIEKEAEIWMSHF